MVQFLTMEFKKRQRYKLMMRVVAWEKNNRAARAARFLVQFFFT